MTAVQAFHSVQAFTAKPQQGCAALVAAQELLQRQFTRLKLADQGFKL